MKFSIIIPAYNSADTITKLLDSLYKHSSPAEVIVVDDGSSDNTLKLLKKYPVKIIQQERQGPAAARNIGARQATGDILIFLDSDTIVLPDTIPELVNGLTGDVAGVNGIYAKRPANNTLAAWYKALLEWTIFNRRVTHYSKFDSRCAAIKRDIFLENDGFNVRYKGADIENEEFGDRLKSRGYNLIINPDAQVLHHFPAFKKMVRTYYRRMFLWMELFLKKRSFDDVLTTPWLGVRTGLSLISLIFFIFSPLFPEIFWFAIILVFIFLCAHIKLYILSVKEKGILFLFAVIFFDYFFSIVISLAALHGFIYNILRKICD